MINLFRRAFASALLLVAVVAQTAPASKPAPETAAQKSQTNAKAPLERGEILVRSYFMEEAKRDVEYALYVPKTYDGERAFPLVVLLHGLGATPRSILGYQGITKEAEARGYVVVAPYGFNERGWYGARGKGKEGPYFGLPSDPDNLGELSEKDVFHVLDLVEKELRIDPSLRFLAGHSMGGSGTVYLGSTRSGTWAALAPLSPALAGPMDMLRGLKQTPVRVVTGDADHLVKVETVRPWVDEMKKLGVPVEFEVIAGGDHVLCIAKNPPVIGRVFDFFDGVRKQREEAAKTKKEDAAADAKDERPSAPTDGKQNDETKIRNEAKDR